MKIAEKLLPVATIALILLAIVPGSAITLNYLESWSGNWDSPTRIVCDSVDHLLYVTCPNAGKILVFNPDGSVNREITTIANPGALAVSGHTNLFVSAQGNVHKLALDGTPVAEIGFNNNFAGPHDIVAASDGRIYVADSDNRIKVFDATGAPLFSFGGSGWFNGQTIAPVAMAVDPIRSELVVCDQNNYRIQVYALNGDSLRRWGTIGNGDHTPGQYLRPWGIDIDLQERIWSYDALLNMVQVYNAGGALLFACMLDRLEMRGAVDIAVDGDRLYLTSPSTDCIEVYQIDESGPPLGSEQLKLVILGDATQARLNWAQIPFADGYHVYRSTAFNFPTGGTDDLGLVSDTSFVDPTAPGDGQIRYYEVTAVYTSLPCFVEYPAESHTTDPIDLAGAQNIIARNHDTPHHVTHGVNCNSCHFADYDHPEPLPEWWFGDFLCKSCHVQTGMAAAEQNHLGRDTTYCNTCHDPHFHQEQFQRYFINSVVATPQGDREVLFNNATDFVHGAPNYDGICETCHTQTAYFRNNESGDHAHNLGSNCVSCHLHNRGFVTN